MSYLKQWQAAKKRFEHEAEIRKAAYKDLKKEAKKLKKLDKKQEAAVANIEVWVAKQEKLRKVKTGLTPVLTAYDKLLPKVEKAIEKKIPASKKEFWKPIADALNKNKNSMNKSVEVVRAAYAKIQGETKTFYKYEDGVREIVKKEIIRKFTAKDEGAEILIRELAAIQKDLNPRLEAIHAYVWPGIEKW